MLNSIIGGRRKHSIASRVEIPAEVEQVVTFCLHLMLRDHEVSVNIVPATMEPNEVAMVSPVSYGGSYSYYEIEVNPDFYDDYELLVFICHECVHIKQMVIGDLITENDQFVWLDELVDIESEPDYWFSPWEIEARGLQQALFEAYQNRDNPEWIDWVKMVRNS